MSEETHGLAGRAAASIFNTITGTLTGKATLTVLLKQGEQFSISLEGKDEYTAARSVLKQYHEGKKEIVSWKPRSTNDYYSLDLAEVAFLTLKEIE